MTKTPADIEWMKKEAFEKLPLVDGAYNIRLIEEKRNATYVIETCLKSKNGGWVNYPANIFYQEEAHPQGSNYFAIYIEPFTNQWMVTDALSSVQDPIQAFRLKNTGAFKWSHYRHDMREVVSGLYIDGGRDYTRIVGDVNSELVEPVELTIDKGVVYYEPAV